MPDYQSKVITRRDVVSINNDRQLRQSDKRSVRQRLDLKGEFALAFLPAITIVIVYAFVGILTRQRLLFTSLASSAFFIYMDPQHVTNRIGTLIKSHMLGAFAGLFIHILVGSTYLSAGLAMVITVVGMIVFDIAHPPAISTSLSFAFRVGNESILIILFLALIVIGILIALERTAMWILEYRLQDEADFRS